MALQHNTLHRLYLWFQEVMILFDLPPFLWLFYSLASSCVYPFAKVCQLVHTEFWWQLLLRLYSLQVLYECIVAIV